MSASELFVIWAACIGAFLVLTPFVMLAWALLLDLLRELSPPLAERAEDFGERVAETLGWRQ